MEELESGQQETQEKIAQMMKMVTNLTKGKGITDGHSLQREPTSWRGNNHGEQKELRKDSFERSNHVDMQ